MYGLVYVRFNINVNVYGIFILLAILRDDRISKHKAEERRRISFDRE